MQTTTEKAVLGYIEKEIDGSSCTAIYAGIPKGAPPGTHQESERVDDSGGRPSSCI